MKELKSHHKILNILFLLNILFILSKEDIFNNPLLVAENENPISIRGSSGAYYIFTSGRHIKLTSTGQIESSNTFPTYNAPYVWIADQNNNYYIFASNVGYKVTINSNIPSNFNKPLITYPSSTKFLGSITETKNDGSSFTGCLCPIVNNEAIVYGRGNSYSIVFSFLKKPISYTITIAFTNMEEKMGCKKIQNGQYLCAVIYGYTVHVYLFSHLSVIVMKCQMKTSLHSDLNNILNNHTSLELFDTDDDNKKIVCAKNRLTFDMECLKFGITITTTTRTLTLSCSQTQETEISDIIIRFPTQRSNIEGCAFKKFYSEYLFCCAGTGKIFCARISLNYDLINTFDLEFPGVNSKINHFSDLTSFGVLFFS